jgi:hypothetical protein
VHPELSKRLVAMQLREACARAGLFSAAVELEQAGYPEFFLRFTNKHGAVRLLRFECTNYDFQAIAVEPVDPLTRKPLQPTEWVRHGGGAFPAHSMKGGGPFFCIAGTRDYYTHESHRPVVTGDRWEKWRAEFRIADLIQLIKGKFSSGEWE